MHDSEGNDEGNNAVEKTLEIKRKAQKGKRLLQVGDGWEACLRHGVN